MLACESTAGPGGASSSGAAGASASGGAGQNASGGGTVTGSAGTGGTGASELDCLNGADDDGDGLVDCGDPDCSGYACIPAYPSPAYYAFPTAGPQPCPNPSISTTAAGCDACSCSPASGSCSVNASLYSDGACKKLLASNTGTGCYKLGSIENTWVKATVTSSGFCQAPPSYPTTPSYACVLEAAGQCPDGQACVPAELATYSPCVVFAGLVACSPPYGVPRQLYDESLTACECSCAATGGACSDAKVTVDHMSYLCKSPSGTVVPADGGCHEGGYTFGYKLSVTNGSPTCTGNPVPAAWVDVYTLCCLS
jgi:hypothetical protein